MTLPAKLLLALALFLIGAYSGYRVEHGHFTDYRELQEAIAQAELKEVVRINELVKERARYAQQDYVNKLQNVIAHYKRDPVMFVRNGTCAGDAPGTPAHTETVDGTASARYASPYSPLDTEIVAVRLDSLQKLLITNGVMID